LLEGRRLLLTGGLGLLAVIVVLQLLPFGRDHSNPPVRQDAPWPDDRARALAATACYDCHSNRTHWPFYSYVAPMSWLVTGDVQRGREKLNFSEWGVQGEDRGGGGGEAHDAAEPVREGGMPPNRYVLTHPGAHLTDDQRRALVSALEAMDQGNRGRGGNGGGDDRGSGGGGGGG
jgi:hypothetical protein